MKYSNYAYFYEDIFLKRGPKGAQKNDFFLLYTATIITANRIITPLPPPFPECKIGIPHVEESFLWQGFITAFCCRTTCCDCLFSGHTVQLTLLLLFAIEFLDETLIKHKSIRVILKIVFVVFTFLGLFTIVAEKFHYLVDVYVGFLITMAMFGWYMGNVSRLEMIREFKSKKSTPLLLKFIEWIEWDHLERVHADISESQIGNSRGIVSNGKNYASNNVNGEKLFSLCEGTSNSGVKNNSGLETVDSETGYARKRREYEPEEICIIDEESNIVP